jgi:hypothetical protein
MFEPLADGAWCHPERGGDILLLPALLLCFNSQARRRRPSRQSSWGVFMLMSPA